MGISHDELVSHVAEWQAKLAPSYRSRWPSRLFRHETLENALEILRARELLSRSDAAEKIQRDVAPEEIINANNLAHGFARLYFRPKTPTQYRIEGIRRPAEIWNGKHAPVLYMFVFKSESILTRQDVRYSRGNMQALDAMILDGDEAFKTLDFRKIYHEGSYDPLVDGDIKVWRCAEVLCPSPLVLDESLEAIVCRSDAERRMLLHKLGNAKTEWGDKIKTVTQPGYFNSEYAYVESVDLNSKALTVRFHPRRHFPAETWVRVKIQSLDDFLEVGEFENTERGLRKIWNFLFEPNAGQYLVNIWIDGELAYESILEYAEDPF